jgi:hypothetical protein
MRKVHSSQYLIEPTVSVLWCLDMGSNVGGVLV